MSELIRYDAMCRAIDAAYEVDEVKDIRDKALAIEAYAKQAKNTEAERRACEIRLRAERKAGALLAGMDKLKGRKAKASSATTLSDLGISRDQSSKWQQLAAVPAEQFEAALAAPSKPSTTSIIGKKQDPMDPRALWLWGRLRDFEREGYLDSDPDGLLEAMTDGMRADVLRLAPAVAYWLSEVIGNGQTTKDDRGKDGRGQAARTAERAVRRPESGATDQPRVARDGSTSEA